MDPSCCSSQQGWESLSAVAGARREKLVRSKRLLLYLVGEAEASAELNLVLRIALHGEHEQMKRPWLDYC